MDQTLERAVQVASAAVARAVKVRDPVAEHVARSTLAAAMLARDITRAHAAGVRFTPGQISVLGALVQAMAGPSEPPSDGPQALARLHAAVTEAEAAGDVTCDRCGADGAYLSGSMDLTGTQSPPI